MIKEEKKAIKNYICKIDWNKGILIIASKDNYLEELLEENTND